MLTRRSVVVTMGSAFAATAFSTPQAHAAAAYHFVRIEGLAEQVVGEVILREIYHRADMDIEITPMPGRQALQEASSGSKDGETLRIYALGERERRLIRVPTPLSDLKTTAFVKMGSNISVSSREDLARHRCAIVSGVLHTHTITKRLRDVVEVGDPAEMFRLIQTDAAEIALTSHLDGLANLRRARIEDIGPVEPTLRTLELFHYVHESKADVVPIIDAIAKDMAASGELAELRNKLETEYLESLG